jgi:hypothetical protein
VSPSSCSITSDFLRRRSRPSVEVRHVRGDWGEFGQCDEIQLSPDERTRGWEATDDSGKINKSNLVNRRDRVISEYTTARGARLWVITRLDGSGGTTVLRPEEY